jgi:hypothetical protein
MIDFLSSLPLWLLGVLLNIWLMGTALVGHWIVRRHIEPHIRLTYNDAYFAAVTAQSAMLLYSLVAALTAVGAWQRDAQVSDIVSGEATAIASLWRDLGGYPDGARDAARDILRGYTNQVIDDAWPKQRRGEIPKEGVEWMDRLQMQLFGFEPTSESQKILHAETLRAFNELVQKRRQRLDSVRSGLPSVFWIVLLPGAMGCIVLMLLFHVESAPFQIFLLLGIAGFLAMVLFIIIALDRPFQGELGIPDDSYRLVRDQYMQR